MFKTRKTDTISFDTMGAVERPVARYGRTDREGAALDLLEDPVEFAQNMHRVLYSSGDFQDLFSADTPKRVEDLHIDMWHAMGEAITRQDWALAKEIHYSMESVTNSAMGEANEYGVALGAVLEQLRQGLLDIMRLRYADDTYVINSMQEDVKKAQDLISGKRKPKAERDAA